MNIKFEVTIYTDEATADELEEAIRDTLRVLDMPNGDTLYIDNPVVDYKSEYAHNGAITGRSSR